MTLENNASNWLWLKLLCLTIIATIVVEHSEFDILISRLFYSNGSWLLEKGAQPYAFIFYDGPKLLLILFSIYLMTVLAWRYWHHRYSRLATTPPSFAKPVIVFLSKELSYLLAIIIIVPTVIATLKGITHVSCPNHLLLFNGDLPYLNLWQSMLARTDAKCFPAAHASAGFSLYGLAFLPTLHKYRYRIFEIVTVLGWAMGLYKMSFGDHFFSHTFVSMLLSLTIACALASVFFKRSAINKRRNLTLNNHVHTDRY